MVIDRLTTSLDARSFALGAYRSMKRSPSELVRYPPSPRTPSVIRHTGAINTGWMKLNEFHILQWQSRRAEYHGVAIARTRVCRRTGKIRSPVTAGGQDHAGATLKPMQAFPVGQVNGDYAATLDRLPSSGQPRKIRYRKSRHVLAIADTGYATSRDRYGLPPRRYDARCPSPNRVVMPPNGR